MDISGTNTSSDPTGSKTLNSISEAVALNKWRFPVISPTINGKVLEIGSGIGNISAFLMESDCHVTLSDLRTEYCEYLSLHFMDNKSLESVEQINLIDNDFENTYQKLLKSFDSVFALNVVEHIEDDNQAINNFRKLLKERGTGIILVPSYQWSVGTLCKQIGFSIDKLLNFNAAGVFGWFLFGKILQGKQFKNNQMNIYNKLVSIFMQIEKLLFQTFGLSLILIGRKQLWGKCFQ